jgi:hypothetical protein
MDPLNDDALLAELGDAVRGAADVPPGFVAAGKAAFTWRNVDAELAQLQYDSASAPASTTTRSQASRPRALTFSTGELTIELELTGEGLLGQLVPPQRGQVQVQTRTGATTTVQATVQVDEVGWFAVRPVPAAMLRLRVEVAGHDPVLTEWITP